MTDAHSNTVVPANDEAETPFWLPALGFGLFVLGGIGWAITPPMQSASPGLLAAPVVVAPASDAAHAEARPAMPAPAPPAAPTIPSTPPDLPSRGALKATPGAGRPQKTKTNP